MRKIFLFLIPIMIVLGSCKKSFLDINQHPNTATESKVTADLIIPYALTISGSISTVSFGGLGRWLGYWSIGSNYATGDEAKYNITTGYGNGTWNGIYDNIFDYQKAQDKATATGQDFYVGIAKIMKAYNFQKLVDVFNNVPYSKALDITNNIAPAYDKGADIYADLLTQITSGMNLIKNADAAKSINLTTADIMFKGNKLKWAKFGNTLKLRILMQMSQTSFNPAPHIATIVAEGSGFLGADETAEVNPGYTSDKPNPFWATYAFDNAGNFPNDFSRANNYVLNLMKGLNDERFKYFFRPVRSGTFAGQYRGVDYGLPTDPAQIYGQGSLSDIGGAATPTGGTTGLAKSATQGSWILTSFESMFLQAEARTRGWLSGSAQTMYENAVAESFNWLGIPNASTFAATYLAINDVKVRWPVATADQIRVIAWQKYFAFNGNNHLGAWNDFRRLDVVTPAISIDPGRIASTIPIRFLFTLDEYSYNAANVTAQGTVNQFTSKVFWDN